MERKITLEDIKKAIAKALKNVNMAGAPLGHVAADILDSQKPKSVDSKTQA